ncbi:MAG: 2-octaprenyl-6-methoxyphenyl hydroxylase [Cocleimonas sp.]
MSHISTTSQESHYDIIIVGGGMVGASLAIALLPLTKSPHNLKVCVIDAFKHDVENQPSYDDRSIALSHGSSLIFKGMGLWDELESKTSPIKQIHISDRGHFGATRLTAEKENVPSLGYLVESRVLGQQLYNALAESNVELMVPASVVAIKQDGEDSVSLEVKKGDETVKLSARLLVAADGTNSYVRELSGIQTEVSDYQQSAIITNVSTQKPHEGQAFERFTENGPIALLPMMGNRSSLVWTFPTINGTDEIDAAMALDDSEFLSQLDQAFGFRLGKFTKVGKRSAYPLSLVTSDKNTAYRTVIVGNASHTLHPVAGQGLNLALRDVAVLSDLLASLISSSDIPNKIKSVAELLVTYEELRAEDLKNTIRYTDSLVRAFSNDNMLLGHARAGGLLAVDRISPMRKWISRQSMGINHRQSRLARGLALRVSA